jgi:hypothetical protein
VFDHRELLVPYVGGLTSSSIYQLSPSRGARGTRVVGNLTVAQYLAVEPANGNLFFQDGVSSRPVVPDTYEIVAPLSPSPPFIVTSAVLAAALAARTPSQRDRIRSGRCHVRDGWQRVDPGVGRLPAQQDEPG